MIVFSYSIFVNTPSKILLESNFRTFVEDAGAYALHLFVGLSELSLRQRLVQFVTVLLFLSLCTSNKDVEAELARKRL